MSHSETYLMECMFYALFNYGNLKTKKEWKCFWTSQNFTNLINFFSSTVIINMVNLDFQVLD